MALCCKKLVLCVGDGEEWLLLLVDTILCLGCLLMRNQQYNECRATTNYHAAVHIIVIFEFSDVAAAADAQCPHYIQNRALATNEL